MAEVALADTLFASVEPAELENIIQRVAERLLSLEPGDDNGYRLAELLFELRGRVASKAATDAQQYTAHDHDVLLFICKTICASRADATRLTPLVHFCKRHPALLESLVSACVVILASETAGKIEAHSELSAQPVETAEPAETALSFSSKSILLVLLSPENGNVQYQRLSGPLASLKILECLLFLKVLVLQHPDYCTKFDPRLLVILAAIVRFNSHKYVAISKDILLGFLSAQAKLPHQIECKQLQPLFWGQVFDLTLHLEPLLVNAGLQIWLRLLSLSGNSWLPRDLFATVAYWQRIQSLLANGSGEQRKMILAIFKRSILLCDLNVDLSLLEFRKSNAKDYQAQYVRFTTVFETVVLARYLNQVQDCLPDLDVLSSSTSLIRPSWIIILLHASLSHGMQDSIRKIIGSWALHRAPALMSEPGKASSNFLEFGFLPWATMGPHFNACVLRESVRQPSCSFGEQLSYFLCEAITTATNAQDTSNILGAALRFLVSKGGRIFSFARAFILEGLLKGIREKTSSPLSKEHALLLCKIVQQQGFQEIVRDLMVLQCHNMCVFGLPSGLQTDKYMAPITGAYNLVQLRKHLDSRIELTGGKANFVQKSSEVPGEEAVAFSAPYDQDLLRNYPTKQLAEWLRNSNERCLSGIGLLTVCNFVYEAFEDGRDVTLAPSDVAHVLRAIWAEASLKDHPRYIMMILPRIVFHRRCIELYLDDRQLAQTLDDIARALWEMTKTRIYVFSPVIVALRRVFLVRRMEQRLFADFILDYANSPPSTRAEFQLERVMAAKLKEYIPARNYGYYYGKPEAFGHACVFDTLNRLPAGDPWNTCCRQILDQLMNRWMLQKHPIPVFTSWKTTAQLQVMLMCFERLTPIFSPTEVQGYLSQLSNILSLEPLPRFRFLLEWIIVRIYLHVLDRRTEVIEKLSVMDISNPKYSASMIKIALMVVCLADTDEKLGQQMMAELVSLSASQKIVIRHEAHWTVPLLWDHAEQQGWKSLTDNVAFARLNRHIRGLDTYKSPPIARIQEQFNPIADHNLTNLVCGQYLMIEPAEAAKASHEDLMAVRQADDAQGGSAEELMPLGRPRTTPYKGKEQETGIEIMQISDGIAATALQTKSSTWHEETMGYDEQSTDGGDKSSRASNGVIVIASLIDSPYNLGGISRVSEIFGVKGLKVKKLNVTKSKDFTSVSVSSHLWLPIDELGSEAIAEYIRERKLEGYKVVGMEQTDNSQVLGRKECRLPWKMVLVLGSEKEGIPGELLSEMDFCVEVRQAGVTRSMNVQTALSVGLYEYQRQHQQPGGG